MTFKILYRWTGLRWQAPIEFFFPTFGPWLFRKVIGFDGKWVGKE